MLYNSGCSALFQSTHPRGVRRSEARYSLWNSSFQSTHPRGVRRQQSMVEGLIFTFQSTHPRGVRPYPQGKRGSRGRVSIHAPTWGATSCNQSPPISYTFQSTHPRGVRLFAAYHIPLIPRFNPRTHVGCDSTGFPCLGYIRVSIHAPTWGATFYDIGNSNTYRRFNPRTHVGCD